MQRASPKISRPGLHAEQLDVTIGRLLAPYRPGASAMVIDGSNTTSTHKKTFSFTVHHSVRKANLKYPTPAIDGLFYGVASGSVLGRASKARSENKNL